MFVHCQDLSHSFLNNLIVKMVQSTILQTPLQEVQPTRRRSIFYNLRKRLVSFFFLLKEINKINIFNN